MYAASAMIIPIIVRRSLLAIPKPHQISRVFIVNLTPQIRSGQVVIGKTDHSAPDFCIWMLYSLASANLGVTSGVFTLIFDSISIKNLAFWKATC
jgi:hypothetical protein